MPFRNAFSQLFTQNVIIAGVIFFLILAALLVAMVLSWLRARRGHGPSRTPQANKVELSYVGALLGIFVFLVISSFTANAKDYPARPAKPALAVRVTGYQWCWRFHYEGTARTSAGQCQGLRDLPVLVLPVGKPVRLDITSADVLHGFWVSHWRVKLYAYPGHVNSLTITIPHAGKWIGRCAQICGVFHYEMDFYLQAVPPATFTTYLRTGRL